RAAPVRISRLRRSRRCGLRSDRASNGEWDVPYRRVQRTGRLSAARRHHLPHRIALSSRWRKRMDDGPVSIRDLAPADRLHLCGLAAGAALGVSWLCKESVAYAAPFCAGLVVAALRKDRRRCVVLWAGVALGAVTVLAGEMTVYHRATGDWLFHFHETERNYHQYKNAFF